MNSIDKIKEIGGEWILDIQVSFPRPSSDGEIEVIVADDIPDDILEKIQDIAADWTEYVQNWGHCYITKYGRYLHDVAQAFINKEIGFSDLKKAVAMYK